MPVPQFWEALLTTAPADISAPHCCRLTHTYAHKVRHLALQSHQFVKGLRSPLCQHAMAEGQRRCSPKKQYSHLMKYTLHNTPSDYFCSATFACCCCCCCSPPGCSSCNPLMTILPCSSRDCKLGSSGMPALPGSPCSKSNRGSYAVVGRFHGQPFRSPVQAVSTRRASQQGAQAPAAMLIPTSSTSQPAHPQHSPWEVGMHRGAVGAPAQAWQPSCKSRTQAMHRQPHKQANNRQWQCTGNAQAMHTGCGNAQAIPRGPGGVGRGHDRLLGVPRAPLTE